MDEETTKRLEAGLKMVGTVWNAQITMFEEVGSAAIPGFVMPLRWEDLPFEMQVDVTAALKPAISQLGAVMAQASRIVRAATN